MPYGRNGIKYGQRHGIQAGQSNENLSFSELTSCYLDAELAIMRSNQLLPLLALSSYVLADYDTNLNYRSPSPRHPRLGIDLTKVRSRGLEKQDEPPYIPASLNVTHDLASGDPYADSVVPWTRVAPSMEADDSDVTVTRTVPLYNHEREKYIDASVHPICVDYRVFDDETAGNVVQEGKAYTTSDIDYTVKVGTQVLGMIITRTADPHLPDRCYRP